MAGVKIEKGEEKVRVGLQIVAKVSTDYTTHPVGTPRAASNIMEELHQMNQSLKQLTEFTAKQQEWNQFMEHAWKETIASLNLPNFHVGPSAKSAPAKKGKAKAKEPIAQTPKTATTDDADKEEFAAHLGGGEPLTGNFTMANLSSAEEA